MPINTNQIMLKVSVTLPINKDVGNIVSILLNKGQAGLNFPTYP